MVQLLCFIKAFEVDSDLSLLLGLDIKLGQVLHKLDALRVYKSISWWAAIMTQAVATSALYSK